MLKAINNTFLNFFIFPLLLLLLYSYLELLKKHVIFSIHFVIIIILYG